MIEPESVERICRLFHPTCWDAVPARAQADFRAFVRRMMEDAERNTITVEQAKTIKAERFSTHELLAMQEQGAVLSADEMERVDAFRRHQADALKDGVAISDDGEMHRRV